MPSRGGLVAQIMLRDPNQPVADQAIVRVGPRRPQDAEPLHQSQSDAMPTASAVKEPQAPERAQPVLGIVKALRYLEDLCPGRADLRAGSTSGMYQRCTQCGVELHLAARVSVRPRRESGKRLLDTNAALLH